MTFGTGWIEYFPGSQQRVQIPVSRGVAAFGGGPDHLISKFPPGGVDRPGIVHRGSVDSLYQQTGSNRYNCRVFELLPVLVCLWIFNPPDNIRRGRNYGLHHLNDGDKLIIRRHRAFVRGVRTRSEHKRNQDAEDLRLRRFEGCRYDRCTAFDPPAICCKGRVRFLCCL